MIIVSTQFGYYRKVFKMILFEDRIDLSLDKPLLVRDYKKLFKREFEPYLMNMTTRINEDIFLKFTKFCKALEMLDYKQPSSFHIVFVNKVDGYIRDSESELYELIVKKDFIPFTTRDSEKIEIIDRIMDLKYRKIEEFNIEGVININKKSYFLSNLTSISSYENVINNRTYSDLVFNFGLTTETLRFNDFKESFDYLFNSDKSDIRLIQKIANGSLINFSKGGDK
jgi:hypothetical protein